MKKKIFLIVNPTSGGGKAKKAIPKIKKFFEKKNLLVKVYETKKPKDAIKASKKARKKYAVVVAMGGDGTINEVANGLANSKARFGIIPFGTENVLAKEFKIPFAPIKAAELIIKGKAKKLDLGKAKNRHFVMMAGIGFDAHVASKVRPVLKKLTGSVAYPITALRELLKYKPSEIIVKVDGRKYKGYFVIVGNTRYYGGKLEVTPLAKADDGFLDVCILKRKEVYELLKVILGIVTKKHLTLKQIAYYKGKKIRIESKKPVLIHVDCELIGTTPVNIEICPKALNLICIPNPN